MSVKDQSKRKRGLSIDQSLENKYINSTNQCREKEINSAESCQLDGDLHELFMVVVPAV